MKLTIQRGRKHFRSKVEALLHSIRGDIHSGKLQVGDFLPSEKSLSERFGLSNNTVRKGLDILVSEGVIEKIPKVGNKVIKPVHDEEWTIRFGYHTSMLEETALGVLLDDFHRRFPQIKVLPVPIVHNSQIDEYIKAGLFDAVTLNYNNFQTISEAGRTGLLTPQRSNPGCYSFLNKAFSHEGELLVQPFVCSPLVLCYNKRHFAEAGLLEPDSSWTWDDLVDTALKLGEKNGKLGFYVHLFSNNRWPVFLLQSGFRFDRDGSGIYRVPHAPCIEGLKLGLDLLKYFKIPPIFENETEAEKLFLEEHVSMVMTNYFRLNRLLDAPFEYDIAPIPHLTEAKTLLLMIGVAICANSAKKEAAQLLVDYLVSYDAQLLVRQNTLSIPSLKPAAEWSGAESMYRPSRFHLYREIAPTFALYTDLNIKESNLNAMLSEAKLYWSGLTTEQDICGRLEKVMN